MIIYALIIILFAISFLPQMRRNLKLQSIQNKLGNTKNLNSILLGWIIIGFFTRLDFNQMWGCIIDFGKVLDYSNIGFSTISLALILGTRFLNSKRKRNILLIVELGIWLFKYGYYKGGYATGFSGEHPLGIVVLYDSIAVFLRLLNLKNINNIRFFNNSWILALVIILTSIKIFYLPMPNDLFWEMKRIEKKIEKNKKLLIGNWSGHVQYDSIWIDTIKTYRLDTICDDIINIFDFEANRTLTDSTHKYFLKDMQKSMSELVNLEINDDMIISTKRTECFLEFIYHNWGSLLLNDSTEYGSFEILNIKKDSLEITVTEGFNRNFEYKLNRK